LNYSVLFARLVRNWPAKVLSIGLAIILFVFYRMSSLETRFFSVPLVVEHLSSMMPSNYYPRTIRVSLRGEANAIFSVLEDDIVAYVDMAKLQTPGLYVVPVQWRKSGTAQGTEPLQVTVDPVEIKFVLDRKISKFVPLIPAFHGQVDSGFSMTSYFLNPNQVIIDGPAELMGSVLELNTDIIDLDGRRSDFSGTVNILHRDPLIVLRGNGTTEFYGIISRIIPVRNIPGVPIIITGLKEGFRAEPEIVTANIHMEGDNQAAVDSFAPPQDFLRIDCSGINEPGIYILRLQSGEAEDVTFRVEPDEVKIQISYAEGR
jgi:hypothetical protein